MNIYAPDTGATKWVRQILTAIKKEMATTFKNCKRDTLRILETAPGPANQRVAGSIPNQGTCLHWGPGPQ